MNKTALYPKLFLYCLLAFVTINCYSQDVQTMPNDPIGSARELKGKTLIINCFVSEPNKEWNPDEKQVTLGKEREGLEWLKRQAIKWGQPPISFQEFNIGQDRDVQVPKLEASRTPWKLRIRWASYALQSAGYYDIYQLYDTLKKQSQADNVVVMIFANKKGRSYAQPASDAGIRFNREWMVEGAVIYNQSMEGEQLWEGTIIHEMLHLFGAWDMYHDDDLVMRSDDIERRVTGALGSSIMLKDHVILCKANTIDVMTAWRIGWTKSYMPWYEMFRRGGDKKLWEEIPHGN